jgi:beta-lactamase class A
VTGLTGFDETLAGVPGTASVWYGRPGAPPAYAHEPDAPHYAASMMKLAVLVAAHREHDAGRLDLDDPVPVHNDFPSAARGRFGCRRRYDNDEAVWDRLGTSVPLRWLAHRMIVRSSNLATNLVLDRIGLRAADDAWRSVGARHGTVGRLIEDAAAAEEGRTNLVTVADLAALLSAIRAGRLGSPTSTHAMIDTLLAQESGEDLAAGLPPDTRAAHKNGWIMGVRHTAGIVWPDDAPAFVLAVCLTTPWAANRHDDEACQLVARLATLAWSHRHDLPERG